MPIHDDQRNTYSRVRATDASGVATEYTHGRHIDSDGVATEFFRRAGLPNISSFTLTPDHYRDTDRTPPSWAPETSNPVYLAAYLGTTAPSQSSLATYSYTDSFAGTDRRAYTAGQTYHWVIRIPAANATTQLQLRFYLEDRATELVSGYFRFNTHGTNYVTSTYTYWAVSWTPPAPSSNWQYTSSALQIGEGSSLGDLTLAFAVTGSVRNTLSQYLADGSAGTNIPLSPSTGATVSAPLQSARYVLLCRNSLGEETHRQLSYTYWTAPTISLGAPENAGFAGGGGVIYIQVTRGGNPLPSVSVVASDGHGSGNVHFGTLTPTTHRYQISGAQTGSPRTVTYTFTATSRVGSETRTATASTSFTWPA